MKAYYKIGSNEILLDFERPVLINPSAVFKINNVISPLVSAGPNTDTFILTTQAFPSDLDDIWVSYTKNPLNPVLYLSGPVTDRIADSFEILALVTNRNSTVITDVTNTKVAPLVSDFVDAYGLTEAITITNPENALAKSPDEYKLIRALEDGEALFNSYVTNELSNSIVIAGKRRTILIFARYFLDSRCRRKVVTEDYENAIATLEAAQKPITEGSGYYDGSELAYSSQSCPEICGCNF